MKVPCLVVVTLALGVFSLGEAKGLVDGDVLAYMERKVFPGAAEQIFGEAHHLHRGFGGREARKTTRHVEKDWEVVEVGQGYDSPIEIESVIHASDRNYIVVGLRPLTRLSSQRSSGTISGEVQGVPPFKLIVKFAHDSTLGLATRLRVESSLASVALGSCERRRDLHITVDPRRMKPILDEKKASEIIVIRKVYSIMEAADREEERNGVCVMKGKYLLNDFDLGEDSASGGSAGFVMLTDVANVLNRRTGAPLEVRLTGSESSTLRAKRDKMIGSLIVKASDPRRIEAELRSALRARFARPAAAADAIKNNILTPLAHSLGVKEMGVFGAGQGELLESVVFVEKRRAQVRVLGLRMLNVIMDYARTYLSFVVQETGRADAERQEEARKMLVGVNEVIVPAIEYGIPRAEAPREMAAAFLLYLAKDGRDVRARLVAGAFPKESLRKLVEMAEVAEVDVEALEARVMGAAELCENLKDLCAGKGDVLSLQAAKRAEKRGEKRGEKKSQRYIPYEEEEASLSAGGVAAAVVAVTTGITVIGLVCYLVITVL